MRGDAAQPDSYVYVTEEGVTRHYADGSVEALAWEDVVEVRVSGSADDRVEEDVEFKLLDRHGEHCVVPRSATDAGFLVHLRHLPEFSLDRLADALGGGPSANVIVWRSPELLAPPDPDFP